MLHQNHIEAQNATNMIVIGLRPRALVQLELLPKHLTLLVLFTEYLWYILLETEYLRNIHHVHANFKVSAASQLLLQGDIIQRALWRNHMISERL